MGSLWNRSGMIERQDDDIRASGALAYFYQGLTTTPLTVYADAAEGTAHTNPVVADANGRWPDVFVPYIVGYDVLVKTSSGVQLSYTQNVPNPDPVDTTVIIPAANQVQTGMVHAEFVNSTKAGYVRLNGRTIGNAVSGGTERANADTSDLFVYLWNNLTDAIAPVSGGRGGSAASDFAANKTITLIDMRGSTLFGLADMGNTSVASTVFPSFVFATGSGIIAGSLTGSNSKILNTANIPAHAHTGSTTTDGAHTHTGTTSGHSADHTHAIAWSGTTSAMSANASHTHTYTASNNLNLTVQGGTPSGVNSGTTADVTGSTNTDHTHTYSGSGTSGGTSANHTHSFTSDSNGNHSHTFTTSTVGSGDGFNALGYSYLVTWFIKL